MNEADGAPGPDLAGAPPAVSATVTIVNARGLHARAAARFVDLVRRFEAEVVVAKDGVEVAGLSIMGLMMFAAAKGTTIEIRATGAEAAAAVRALVALVNAGFHES
ncbi:MAG: HPr family phosphocarrier protein [Alphaproteobacteria bacterium]|nr:HPr family phosphocarrier protein [Alphaproteobacteria bacterium]